MGGCCSSRNLKIVMVGLDASGKSRIMFNLTQEKYLLRQTIGFNVETVQHRGRDLDIFQVSGAPKVWPLWRHYYDGVHALIFVVDGNDRDRLGTAFSTQKMHLIVSGFVRSQR